jgi:GTP-binding protein
MVELGDTAELDEIARKLFSGPIAFLKSAPSLNFLPNADAPEVAFAADRTSASPRSSMRSPTGAIWRGPPTRRGGRRS